MQIKAEKLSGAALDWAVAMFLELTIRIHTRDDGFTKYIKAFYPLIGWEEFSPSTNWAFGGPLKEDYGITSGPHHSVSPAIAHVGSSLISEPWAHRYMGRTQLIASMRCIVGTQVGSFVEIPEELINYEIS